MKSSACALVVCLLLTAMACLPTAAWAAIIAPLPPEEVARLEKQLAAVRERFAAASNDQAFDLAKLLRMEQWQLEIQLYGRDDHRCKYSLAMIDLCAWLGRMRSEDPDQYRQFLHARVAYHDCLLSKDRRQQLNVRAAYVANLSKVVGGQHPLVGVEWAELALNHADLGQFPEAQAAAQKAIPILQKAGWTTHRGYVTSYLMLAVALAHSQDFVAATEAFRAYRQIQNSHGPELAVRDAATILIEYDLTEPILTVDSHADLLRRYRTVADEPELQGKVFPALYLQATLSCRARDVQAYREEMEQLEQFLDELPDTEFQRGLALNPNDISVRLCELGNSAAAERLVTRFKRVSAGDRLQIARLELALAMAEWDASHSAQAMETVARARGVLLEQPDLLKYELGILDRALAEICLDVGQLELAAQFAKSADARHAPAVSPANSELIQLRILQYRLAHRQQDAAQIAAATEAVHEAVLQIDPTNRIGANLMLKWAKALLETGCAKEAVFPLRLAQKFTNEHGIRYLSDDWAYVELQVRYLQAVQANTAALAHWRTALVAQEQRFGANSIQYFLTAECGAPLLVAAGQVQELKALAASATAAAGRSDSVLLRTTALRINRVWYESSGNPAELAKTNAALAELTAQEQRQLQQLLLDEAPVKLGANRVPQKK